MKKILLIAFGILNLSLVAQTTDNGQIEKLSRDLKTLKTENEKLKTVLTDSIQKLNKSIEDMRKLYRVTDKELKTDENSLNAATSSLGTLDDYTHSTFQRYRSIIKTSILIGMSAIFILMLLFAWMFLKLGKSITQSEKDAEEDRQTLMNAIQTFDEKIKLSTEMYDTKTNEMRKLLAGQIADSKNLCESMVEKTKEQLKKDVADAGRLSLDQFTGIKTETTKQFETLKAQISAVEKIIAGKK